MNSEDNQCHQCQVTGGGAGRAVLWTFLKPSTTGSGSSAIGILTYPVTSRPFQPFRCCSLAAVSQQPCPGGRGGHSFKQTECLTARGSAALSACLNDCRTSGSYLIACFLVIPRKRSSGLLSYSVTHMSTMQVRSDIAQLRVRCFSPDTVIYPSILCSF